ncbi:hypothetical protein [Methylocystis echinoides]|jgi:hypothetical protein|uniref:hypothetical protein n=1 Tax=Methylocystis echinoides TaxID=29468 RepID=UPI00342F8194
MKKFLFLFAILPTLAYAGDDAVDCAKKNDGSVKCDVKKDQVVVDAIVVNGGDCPVAENDKVLHHAYKIGEKFTVPAKSDSPLPGFGGCSYVRAVTIKTNDGKQKTFAPL